MRRDNDKLRERLDMVSRQLRYLRRVFGFEGWKPGAEPESPYGWASEELYEIAHRQLEQAEDALEVAVIEWRIARDRDRAG
jgi:hypothetical protein